MTVTSDVINSASCGLDTSLRTVEIDKFGSKYSMHKIAHVKHWDMHMSSWRGALVINHGSYTFGLTNFPDFSRSKGAPVVWRGALPMSKAFKVAFLDITIKQIRQARLIKHYWINLKQVCAIQLSLSQLILY